MNKCLQKILALSAFVLGFGAATAVLADDKTCTACHDQSWDTPVLAVYATKHGNKADSRTPGCQSCHGASASHLQSPSNSPDLTFTAKSKNSASDKSAACLGCHKGDSKRSHWAGSTHDKNDVACASCHTVHAAKDKVLAKATQFEVCFTCHKEQRAQLQRPSRHAVIEGKVSCSDCHNPHGSVGPKLVKRDSVVETCYQCHMEKRGPFVHNHEPVNEDCGNCHSPHGTVVENLLKVRPPFLCHQCHTPHGGFIPQTIGAQITSPGTTVSTPAVSTGAGKGGVNVSQGRACMNCHTQVHGSNNPTATNPTPQFMLR